MFLGWNSDLTVTNSKFTENNATAGNDEHGAGAIAFISPKNLTVRNSDFINNKGINGGAINSLNGKVTIENSNFIGNDTTAAFFALNDPTDAFLRGFGGALYTDRASSTNESSGTIKITKSVFKDNKGRGEGGGAYLFTAPGDSVTIADSLFQDNEILPLPGGGSGGIGGGLVIMTNEPNRGFTLTNTTVAGNKAPGQGGGIWVINAPTTIINSTFSGNQVTTTAVDGYGNVGGAILLDNARATIVNSTIADNYAGWVGGGISVNNADVSVRNTIFSNNTSGNPFNIQQHTNQELINEGGNIQSQPKKTNNFNDYNATENITLKDPLLGSFGKN